SKTMEEVVFRAERDMLTGLYNREKFYRETEKRLHQNKTTVYLIIQWNIDRFKVVNDLFGSKVGDQVLIQMANLFRASIGGCGTYGRMEADHFVSCVPKSYFEKELDTVIQFLHNGIEELNVGYPIVAHIGIYEITDIDTPVDLMCDRANLALHTIKGNYLKRHAYYNDILRNVMLDEQELIGDMEAALAKKEFFINLQPVFNTQTRTPVSAEALVRWRHPTKGVISPGVFIPLFEKIGFITELDMFVWEEVCKVLADFRKNGTPMVPISVNVSRMNFYSQNLLEKIVGLLDKYGLEPSMIKLEITESAYTDNPRQLLEMMEILQKHGFLILMDDFGSGYSSLNMLKDVPVDILKIDMKFMDRLDLSERAGNILTNVIRMAKSLNMQVVAEGVETKNQYNFLKKMSCDCIQGYYFSKPLSVEDYTALMRKKDTFEVANCIETKKKTILVVDDSEISRMAVVATLEEEYAIMQAENGEQALRVLKENSRTIDMIITDIMMPVMDGFQLLHEIVKDNVFRHIPTVVVTAMSKQADEIKALELGAVDVIVKPFDPTVILKRIENLLRLSEVENIQAEFQIMKKNQEVRHNIEEIIDNSQAGICRLRLTRGSGGKDSKIVYANRTFYDLRGLQKVVIENIDAFDYVGANVVESDYERVVGKIRSMIAEKSEHMETLYRMKNLKLGMTYIRFECKIQYLEKEYIIDMTEIELTNSEGNEEESDIKE
ncbi:MAG: EAL domain-containing protein, partial [Acetivibrio sp.]